jgi:N-acetylneuraminic acid mutarotase
MPEPSDFLSTATLPDGKLLVAEPIFQTAYTFDPSTGAWSSAGRMQDLRSFFPLVTLPNGSVLAVGGNGGDQTSWGTSAEVYTPTSGQWSATGSVNHGRAGEPAVLLPTGKVLVAGGMGLAGDVTSAELYDWRSESWAPTGSMLYDHGTYVGVLLADGRFLAIGGVNTTPIGGVPVATTEIYDPSTGRWAGSGTLSVPRGFTTATVLQDGKVLVAGGITDHAGTPTATAELYDPGSNTWSPTGSMHTARFYHAATLLPDGRVVVTGGSDGHVALASSEIYDPRTGSWSPTESMPDGRLGHSTFTLPDGRVLVFGGCHFSCDGPTPSGGVNPPYYFTPPANASDNDLALQSVPGAITTEATDPSGATLSYSLPTASDEGGETPEVVCAPASGTTFAIGTTTVTCTATDTDDLNSPVTATFAVTVTGAAQQLTDLQTQAQGVGPGRSLSAKVMQAQSALASGNPAGACGALTGFKDQVRAQSGKTIPADRAAQLMTDAQRIEAVIGC